MAPTGSVPVIEVGQLHSQQRGLQAVEALVVASANVLALRALAQIAKLSDAGRERGVARADGASVPQRSQVLARIKRKRGSISQRASAPAIVGCPVCLRSVLKHEQTVSLRKSVYWLHIAR